MLEESEYLLLHLLVCFYTRKYRNSNKISCQDCFSNLSQISCSQFIFCHSLNYYLNCWIFLISFLQQIMKLSRNLTKIWIVLNILMKLTDLTQRVDKNRMINCGFLSAVSSQFCFYIYKYN